MPTRTKRICLFTISKSPKPPLGSTVVDSRDIMPIEDKIKRGKKIFMSGKKFLLVF